MTIGNGWQNHQGEGMGEWRIENGKLKMESGKWTMESGQWTMDNGKWMGEGGVGGGVVLLPGGNAAEAPHAFGLGMLRPSWPKPAPPSPGIPSSRQFRHFKAQDKKHPAGRVSAGCFASFDGQP
jgi:hypothetical protein